MVSKFSEFDKFCMGEALAQAKIAFERGEVPVGAVLTLQDKIIARGFNQVESNQDASCHAEMMCLRLAAREINDWRLSSAVLYVTLEPCIMCAGASVLFRLSKIVYGAKDFRHGGCGSQLDVFAGKHPIHNLAAFGGLMESESKELLQKFFQQRRRENKWMKSHRYDCLMN